MKTQLKANFIYHRELTEVIIAMAAQKLRGLTLGKQGFTLVEILVVCAVIGILASIALPAFSDLKDKANISRSVAEIRGLEKDIYAYSTDAAKYPDSLVDINRNNQRDPWGNLYIYYKIPDAAHTGAYKEWGGTGFINDDFDLYSWGADGVTAHEITVGHNDSSDDIIRGRNGGVVELGSEW